jgi:hypothetical protein
MPSIFEQNAIYLQSGDPTKENAATLAEPGLLGARFTIQHPFGRSTPGVPPRTKRFQLVKSDPGMATPVALGSPAYWLDKSQYLVTTNPAALNELAGVFSNPTLTSGNYGCIQMGGPCPVKLSGANVTAANPGDNVIGGAVGLGVLVASGTALTNLSLGRVSQPAVKDVPNALVTVDLDLPENV